MTNTNRTRWFCDLSEHGKRVVAAVLAVALFVSSFPAGTFAATPVPKPAGRPVQRPLSPKGAATGANTTNAEPESPAVWLPDSIALGTSPLDERSEVVEDEVNTADGRIEVVPVDTVTVFLNDSIAAVKEDEWVAREVEFNPDPGKATWMSALFPGLGQIYNRRYWKLPIIVGGYLGLAYATNWNNSMLRDYTVAYADLLDNDPNTRSYMDMFSPNVKEETLDRNWLQSVLQSRKNYFRRNRDLCIICMIGVYLLAMVDAYVDASLSHFDITPDLSMDMAPALMQDGRQRYPSVGLVWALNF